MVVYEREREESGIRPWFPLIRFELAAVLFLFVTWGYLLFSTPYQYLKNQFIGSLCEECGGKIQTIRIDLEGGWQETAQGILDVTGNFEAELIMKTDSRTCFSSVVLEIEDKEWKITSLKIKHCKDRWGISRFE